MSRYYRMSFILLFALLSIVLMEMGVGMWFSYGWLKGEILSACTFVINSSFGRLFLDIFILRVLPVTMVLLLFSSFIYAISRSLSSIFRTSILLKSIKERIEPDAPMGIDRHIATSALIVVRDFRPYAFTIGYIWPRVVVSTSLLSNLNEEERMAVIIHEDAHRRRRDPLRQLVVNFAADFLWFLPWVGRIKDSFELSKEVVADEDVLARTNKPLALAGAIMRSLKGGISFLSSTRYLSFLGFLSIEKRMEMILEGDRGMAGAGVTANFIYAIMTGVLIFVSLLPLALLYLSSEGILPYTGLLIGVQCL